MNRNLNIFVGLMLAALIASGLRPAAAQEREADHEALRALLRTAVKAVNDRNLDLLTPMLARKFTIISVDNQKFTSLESFKTYWKGLFEGPGHVLDRVEVNGKADELTQFLDDDVGVAYGTSDDAYHFSNGDVRNMASRWSATVQKEPDGWKLVAVHLSTNLFDNPVIDTVKSRARLYAAAAFAGGLVVGGLLVFFVGRGRRVKPGHA